MAHTPRIVIDTNAVLDLFVFDDPAARALLPLLRDGAAQWIATAAMRDELQRVLTYPHIARRWESTAISAESVLAEFDTLTLIKPAAARAAFVCKDPDDQQFIDLALAWQALLLSKDRAVLSMARRMARLGVVVAASWAALQTQAASMDSSNSSAPLDSLAPLASSATECTTLGAGCK